MAGEKRQVGLVHITTIPESLGFLTGQVRYMKSRGFDVSALSSPGKKLHEFGEQEGCPTYSVEMPRRITPLRDLAAIVSIWRVLRRIRPHIVDSHTPKGGLLGTIAAWLARVPVRVYHIHGLPMLTATGIKRLLLTWSEKVSCRLATQVICVSFTVRDVAIEERLCPAGKIKVLWNGSINGVDAEHKFNPANLLHTRSEILEEYGIPNDAIVVGFVGRIVRDKGVVELVGAWKKLREEFRNMYLLVAGAFEPHDPVPPEVAETLRTDPRIVLIGHTDDMPAVYSGIDIMALPTYREGFSTVSLEAAAMEAPVVVSRIPGCMNAVRDRVTGTHINVRDAEALADAVRAYLNDPAMARRHGIAGRSRMLREFRPEDVWAAMKEEYCRLLSEKSLPMPQPDADHEYTVERLAS